MKKKNKMRKYRYLPDKKNGYSNENEEQRPSKTKLLFDLIIP